MVKIHEEFACKLGYIMAISITDSDYATAREIYECYTTSLTCFVPGGAKGTIMSRTLVKDRASGQRLVVILKRITGFTLGQNGFNLFRVKTLIYKRLVTKTSRLVTNTS